MSLEVVWHPPNLCRYGNHHTNHYECDQECCKKEQIRSSRTRKHKVALELHKDIYGASPGITWIDTATVYGYTISIEDLGISYDYTLRYLIADGFLYSMDLDMESSFSNTTMNFERLGGGLDTMTLIVVVGGGIAIIIIAVVILKMRH